MRSSPSTPCLRDFRKFFRKFAGDGAAIAIKSQRNPRVRLTSERTSFAKQLFATKYSSLNLRLIATETNSEESVFCLREKTPEKNVEFIRHQRKCNAFDPGIFVAE
jgi:hypothetical protein